MVWNVLLRDVIQLIKKRWWKQILWFCCLSFFSYFLLVLLPLTTSLSPLPIGSHPTESTEVTDHGNVCIVFSCDAPEELSFLSFSIQCETEPCKYPRKDKYLGLPFHSQLMGKKRRTNLPAYNYCRSSVFCLYSTSVELTPHVQFCTKITLSHTIGLSVWIIIRC